MSAIAEARRIYEAKLSADNAEAAGFEVYSAEQMEKIAGSDNARGRAAFEIPYPLMEGYSRFRYLGEPDPTIEGKAPKYHQRGKTPCATFLPPCVDWTEVQADTSRTVYAVEGETKAWVCALLTGLPFLSIGGVGSFRAQSGSDDLALGLEEFAVEGRTIRIMFDSYRKLNKEVLKQRAAFKATLRLRRCKVEYVPDLPIPKGAKEEKPDDYAMRTSGEALRQRVAPKETIDNPALQLPERMRNREMVTLRELCRHPFPPPKWIVDEFVPEKSLVVLAGQPGAGKTFLACDWIVQAAKAGHRVLLYEHEGTQERLSARLDRAAVFRKLTDEERDRVGVFHGHGMLTDTAEVELIREEAKRHRADLIVLDNLRAAAAGAEENSATEMGLILKNANDLKNDLDATVLLLHHSNKDVWKEGADAKAPTRASAKDVGGSGAIIGNCDLAYVAQKYRAECAFKKWIAFRLDAVKGRDIDDNGPGLFLRIHMSGAEAKVEPVPMAVKGQDPTTEAARDLRAKVLAKIPYEFRKDGRRTGTGATKTGLAKELGERAENVRAAVDALVSSGKVVERKRNLFRPAAADGKARLEAVDA